MKQVLSVLSITVLIFSACAQQKKTATSSVKQDKTGMIEQIAMERTACFGRCPAYRLEINKDGNVKYISRSSTEYEGTFTQTFSKEKVAGLFTEFASYRVDTCQSEYKNLIADVPGLIFYIHYKGQNEPKEIMNAHFGPDFLKDLAGKADSFSKVDESWTKVAEKNHQ